jgi:undecaprenyl diphosphate synthase
VSFTRTQIEDKKLQDALKEAGSIPRHIAIIMDGNGRWAQKRGLPRIAGHREGVNSVREIVEVCGELGVEYLTLYAFSTENWKRPKEEISMLMRLLLKVLRDERDRLHRNNVQLKAIGDIASLPEDVQNELLEAIELTRHNKGLKLVLALSYSGRWEIANAIRNIVTDVKHGKIKKEEIDEELVQKYLTTRDWIDPDLMIRTSGELRISNFLLWQLAYTEIYISKDYWPDFRRRSLYAAIADFQKRERRYGMTSEQLSQKVHTSYVERFLKSVAKL